MRKLQKPEPYVLQVSYWRCNIEKHRHKKKTAAQRCIRRTPASTMREVRHRQLLRAFGVLQVRLNSLSTREAAKKIRLSPVRVLQVMHFAIRKASDFDQELDQGNLRRTIGFMLRNPQRLREAQRKALDQLSPTS